MGDITESSNAAKNSTWLLDPTTLTKIDNNGSQTARGVGGGPPYVAFSTRARPSFC